MFELELPYWQGVILTSVMLASIVGGMLGFAVWVTRKTAVKKESQNT